MDQFLKVRQKSKFLNSKKGNINCRLQIHRMGAPGDPILLYCEHRIRDWKRTKKCLPLRKIIHLPFFVVHTYLQWGTFLFDAILRHSQWPRIYVIRASFFVVLVVFFDVMNLFFKNNNLVWWPLSFFKEQNFGVFHNVNVGEPLIGL
jgi:hypothetical protein